MLAALGLVAVATVAYLITALMPPPDLLPLRTKFWELLVGAVSAFGTLQLLSSPFALDAMVSGALIEPSNSARS
ncbi:hypothetical protein J2X16_000792 [Pelomonas aquatica]|uniref:Uncharacterized protein n=1 Tax=Pelomonas aquatica TaxID=431058 RepID=A0ABU1Z624_9BURK|nr:hypothetical protein [Pelomonas aquatica]MDR7295471.1 hypothetical protein [Pelomonas aquatica]